MKSNMEYIAFKFFAIIFCASVLKSYASENVFSSIHVNFPDNPCSDAKIEMPDFTDIGESISEVKCLQYIWHMRYEQGKVLRQTQCERIKDDRIPILGGSDVSYGEYAHMAALGWKAAVGTWIFKCGSSLISEKYVLTAAHCSCVASSDTSVADVRPKIVRLGGKSIMDVDKGEPAYDVNILRFIQHHRFKPPKHYYDIALVELEQEVSFSWRVHPACLWTTFDNPKEATVTGWGVIETGSLKTCPDLQKANISVIEFDDCDRKLELKRNERKWWGLVWHQICAEDSSGQIDTCKGDSGGPLQTLVPLRKSTPLVGWKLHQIVGVTSFGFGCASPNIPGIYTRVASFISWIENIVWPSKRKLENRFAFKT